MKGLTPDHRVLVKAVKRRGYDVAPLKNGHIGVKDKTGHTVYGLPLTPGDHRWYRNAVADMIQRGILEMDPKKEGQMARHSPDVLSQRQKEIGLDVISKLRKHGWPDQRGPLSKAARWIYHIDGELNMPTLFKSADSVKQAIWRLANDHKVSDPYLDVVEIAMATWEGQDAPSKNGVAPEATTSGDADVSGVHEQEAAPTPTPPPAPAAVEAATPSRGVARRNPDTTDALPLHVRVLAALLDPGEYSHYEKVLLAAEVMRKN